jgi:hypothetical protein
MSDVALSIVLGIGLALTPTIAVSEVALESELEAQVAALNAAEKTGTAEASDRAWRRQMRVHPD